MHTIFPLLHTIFFLSVVGQPGWFHTLAISVCSCKHLLLLPQCLGFLATTELHTFCFANGFSNQRTCSSQLELLPIKSPLITTVLGRQEFASYLYGWLSLQCLQEKMDGFATGVSCGLKSTSDSSACFLLSAWQSFMKKKKKQAAQQKDATGWFSLDLPHTTRPHSFFPPRLRAPKKGLLTVPSVLGAAPASE